MITARIISLIIGYAFGLFPTGLIVSHFKKVDLKHEGSGNTGMTNSLRVMGWRAGITVLVGDLVKCIIPAVIVWSIFKNDYSPAVRLLEIYAGLGAICGHNFPFYAKFKGGKGITCTIGVIFATDWKMCFLCAVAFFGFVLPTKYVSLGSLGMISTFLIQVIVAGQMGWLGVADEFVYEFYIIAAIITALGFFQHRSNIKRLMSGTENKFKVTKK